MDLVMRGSILMPPKTNTVRIPSCKAPYQQHNQAMLMLQTHHDRVHARKISHSIICAAQKKGRPKISGPPDGRTNGHAPTMESAQSVSSGLSSSKSTAQKDVNKSTDADANPKENKSV